MPYVSITGLQLNSLLHLPAFMWHAVRSMNQAQKAPGNISVDARSINGVRHTLSVWQSEADMRAYIKSGAHLKAMKAFQDIAHGKTFGFEAQTAPTWNDVHRLWIEKGRPI